MRDADLTGTSALVTGGASGLGEGTVRVLAPLGVRCTIFDRNQKGAEVLAEEVGANFVAGDVTDPADCRRAVERAAEGAQLRIVVNCAGTALGRRLIGRDNSPHDLEAFKSVQELNVVGTFNVMTRAASVMALTEPLGDGERGVIVNTASVAAFDGQVGQLAYSASKGAVVAMTLPRRATSPRSVSASSRSRPGCSRPPCWMHSAMSNARHWDAQCCSPGGWVSRPSSARWWHR